MNTYGGKYAQWNDKSLADYKAGDDVVERYSFSPCDGKHPDVEKELDDPAFECGAASGWLWAKADAMQKYLRHVANVFKADKIYVTEFGVDVDGESDMEQAVALKDEYREEYYRRYMVQIAQAKNDDVPIKGVFAWSLMDNFEWGDGLNFRFGITYVNFTDMTRHPKQSSDWWKSMLTRIGSSNLVV